MDAWLLHAAGREHRAEVFDIELPRGIDQRTDAHLPGTEELIVCVKGRVRVGPYDQEVELARATPSGSPPTSPTTTSRCATRGRCAG